MNKNLLVIAGVFLAVVVVGIFLLKRPKTQTPATQGMPVPGATNVVEKIVEQEGVTSEGSIREITVSGNEYSFNPSSIVVSKGEKVRLTFTNVGNISHNLVINELNVATKIIGRGKSETVEFTAEKAGTFSFYCGVGNHQSLGMEGELKVE